MVNKEEFSKRLELIFDYYDLTASAFADQIEVGKATISHLLSGRNNPSLDFVLRVVKNFPEVELYWLLNGKGTFPKSDTHSVENETDQAITTTASTSPLKETQKTEADSIAIEKDVLENTVPASDVERIVIFFKNGTFKSYTTE